MLYRPLADGPADPNDTLMSEPLGATAPAPDMLVGSGHVGSAAKSDHQPTPQAGSHQAGQAQGSGHGRRVHVLEDDKNLADILVKACTANGFDAQAISDQQQWEAFRQQPSPDIVVLDLNLGFASGLDCLDHLVANGFDGSVILISGCDDRVFRFSERICQEMGTAVISSLNKPFSTKSFIEALGPLKKQLPAISVERFKQAIDQQEFVPFFQPLVDLNTGAMNGLEILARWQHPDKGLLLPGEFIANIEGLGLMPSLSLSLLRQAIVSIDSIGLLPPTADPDTLTLSLNISPSSLLVPGFSDQLLSTIDEVGGQPAHIKIEITESVAFAGLERIMRVLTRLRIAGLRISIDDFGTGYSSLTALHELPFSDLKIDRSFIMRMMSDPEADTIVRSLIKLAHNLGLEVVGEGIENAQTLAALKRRHCDRGQGFHIAKPMSAGDLAQWQSAPPAAD